MWTRIFQAIYSFKASVSRTKLVLSIATQRVKHLVTDRRVRSVQGISESVSLANAASINVVSGDAEESSE